MLVRSSNTDWGHRGTLLTHSLGHWRAGSWLLMEKCLKQPRTRDGNIINKDWTGQPEATLSLGSDGRRDT